MWSGRETLLAVEHTVEQARDQQRVLDEQVDAAAGELLRLGQEEAEAYRRLAALRLDAAAGGGVATAIDAAEARVAAILAERERARAELDETIGAAETRAAALAAHRTARLAALDEASAALDHGEAATQARLAEDPPYRELLEAARQADAVADQAEAKTARAEQDRTDKGRPYESDPLFSYLWRRAYGTAGYRANRLARMLDAWVARLCRYHEARPNYAMLLEIPRRLGEHAKRLRAAAEGALEALAGYEEQAGAGHGLPALREAVDRARAAVDEAEAEIRVHGQTLNELLTRRQAFAAGRDPHSGEALEALVAAFRGERLGVLREFAESTPAAEDDRIVARLADVERRRHELTDALERDRQMQERASDRVRRLEELVERFKDNRYDGLHNTFSNGEMLAMLLMRYLEGIASAEDLWQAIELGRSYRRIESDPDFGSGGIGRRRRSTWHVPGPRMPAPRGGGWGGGGFRTGGGFGRGGGFRTGGGF